VVNLAHTLGLTVVAEGVERQSHLEELLRLNCRYAQGFLWSPGVPLDVLVERVAFPPWRQGAPRGPRPAGTPSFEPMALPRSLLDSLPFPTAVLDHTGTIISTNLAWKRFERDAGPECPGSTGVGANYLAVCDAAQGVGADVAQHAAAGIRGVLDGTREVFGLEYQAPVPGGDERWFGLTAAPMWPAGGAVVMHLETTERRRAEQALRVSEAQARATFERCPIGIVRGARSRFGRP
jgi:hypothetical protein